MPIMLNVYKYIYKFKMINIMWYFSTVPKPLLSKFKINILSIHPSSSCKNVLQNTKKKNVLLIQIESNWNSNVFSNHLLFNIEV